MKQIGRELWVENCCKMGIVKLCLLLFMLLGSVIIRDYPYSIICLLLLTSLEITTLRLYGQIAYILPQTSGERKRSVILRSALVAGLYSAVNTASYVLLVWRREDLSWNLEVVLFLIYMTVIFFFFYFTVRAALFCVGSNQIPEPEGLGRAGKTEKPKKRLGGILGIGGSVLASQLSVFSCLFYIIYRFGKISFPFPAVLVRHDTEIMLVLGGVTFVLELREVIHCIQGMDFSEYLEV